MCLIGTNSENGRLGRLGICILIDSPNPKTASLAGLAGLLNSLLQKAAGLVDIGEILNFHLQNSENEATLHALLR